MDSGQSNQVPGDEGLNRIIAEYLEALEAGKAPDRQAVLLRHPDLAEELGAFFADHERMKELAEARSPVGEIPAVKSGGEAPTLPPREPVAGQSAGDATLPASASKVMAQDAASPAGTRVRYFGDYELLEEIARGGMGVVYKARQMRLNRIVALKMILSGQLASEEEVQRFHAEAEAAAKLDHPGIVPIYEVGEHEGQHYFSMGYVEGQSLAARVGGEPLPPRHAAALARKISDAVAYAHKQGVIHRDLKPANVLLEESRELRAQSQELRAEHRAKSTEPRAGNAARQSQFERGPAYDASVPPPSAGSPLSALHSRPRITDFGLAKRIEDNRGLTATGQVLGTPSYMPPEQAAGKSDRIGPASDVYAVGAILYELLTGRPPFRAETPLDTLMQVLENQPAPPRLLNPNVPRDLETIAMKCLEKEPNQRYASAGELADDLERFLQGDVIRASSINLLDRAARALTQSRHDEHFRNWGQSLIAFGAVIFLAHAVMQLLITFDYGPLVGYWIPRAVMFAALLVLLWRARPQSMLPTGSVERPIWAVWIGYLVALGSLNAVMYLRGHSEQELFACAAVLTGLGFFVMGSHVWGGGYAIGLGFWVAAPLLVGSSESSAFWFGVLWGLALLAFGVHFWRRGGGGQRPRKSEIAQ